MKLVFEHLAGAAVQTKASFIFLLTDHSLHTPINDRLANTLHVLFMLCWTEYYRGPDGVGTGAGHLVFLQFCILALWFARRGVPGTGADAGLAMISATVPWPGFLQKGRRMWTIHGAIWTMFRRFPLEWEDSAQNQHDEAKVREWKGNTRMHALVEVSINAMLFNPFKLSNRVYNKVVPPTNWNL